MGDSEGDEEVRVEGTDHRGITAVSSVLMGREMSTASSSSSSSSLFSAALLSLSLLALSLRSSSFPLRR